MTSWSALRAELDAWTDTGRNAAFWWRDDDAVARTPALERLVALSERCDAPVHLAVIPAGLERSLPDYLQEHPSAYVLQHALTHTNHEPKPHRASEVGIHRALDQQIADLNEGWQRLRAANVPRLLPVLVPPWNRIAPDTIPHLPALGYAALSRYGPRDGTRGILEINAHLDPMRWKPQAHFAGTEKLLRGLIARLEDVRLGRVDQAEPTGICTHHLVTCTDTWAFLDTLFDTLTSHPAATWQDLSDYLPRSQAAHG